MKQRILVSILFALIYPSVAASAKNDDVLNLIDNLASPAVQPASSRLNTELPDYNDFLSSETLNTYKQKSERSQTNTQAATARVNTAIETELSNTATSANLAAPANANNIAAPVSVTHERASSASVVASSFSQPVTFTQPEANVCQAAKQVTQSGKPMSVYEIISLSVCNNPTAKDILLRLKSYEIAKDDSYASYMPTIDLDSTYGHNKQRVTVEDQKITQETESWNNTLTLNWLLFDFGQRESNVGRAKSQLMVAEFLSHSELQDVILDTAQKYFTVIASEAYLEAARDIEVIAYKSLQVTQGKRQIGIGVLADELQAKNAALSSTNYRIQAEGDLKVAMGALASLIGSDISKNLSLPKNLSVPSSQQTQQINRLIQQGLEQHPKILAAKEQMNTADKSLEIAQRDMLPSVYFTSSLSNDTPKSGNGYKQDNVYMGLNVKVPLFSGFSRYNAVRSARNDLAISQNSYRQVKQDIELQVWQNYQYLVTSQNNIANMRELVTASERAYEIARGRYQSGMGSILELLNTQNNLSEAKISDVNTLVQWHISRLSLAASLGQLNIQSTKNASF